MPFAENYSTGNSTVAQTGDRLVKRRRAMLESTPPRNSQPETHPDDERRRRPAGRRLHRMERFPDAWENSLRKPPRSGILFVLRFEFRWRQIAKRGVKPLLVVDFFEKLRDTGS